MLIVQRWILARLRRRTFFSLDELNQAIWELLDELNTRPFQKLEGCRRSVFIELEQPVLRALPPARYEFAERQGKGVNIDYHVEFEKRYYSVHYRRVHQRVEVRATAAMIEIFQNNERIALHRRSYGPKGTYVTDPHSSTRKPPRLGVAPGQIRSIGEPSSVLRLQWSLS